MVTSALGGLGYSNVKRIAEPVLPEDSSTKRIGLINLFPMEGDPASLRKTFELYLACAAIFETGPSFLVTAVSEDGAYGFDVPSETGDMAGAVAGPPKPSPGNIPTRLYECWTCILILGPSKHQRQSSAVSRKLFRSKLRWGKPESFEPFGWSP